MNTETRIKALSKPSPEIISLAERVYSRLWAVNYVGEIGRKERLEDIERIAKAIAKGSGGG